MFTKQLSMLTFKAAAGDKALDAVGLAAVALRRLAVFRRMIVWQYVVTPLTGAGVRHRDQPIIYAQPAAATGAEDHAKHHAIAFPRTVDGF